MQTLFEWDFMHYDTTKAQEILERNAKEFAPGLPQEARAGDFSFTKKLLEGILKKQKTLDSLIEKAAPEWPLSKVSIVDRNVLRIGLYELLFGVKGEVPPKVAINEAIELAKTFSGLNSGKFINGVLGSVYRELGEPGKNDKPVKKNHNIDPAKMPIYKKGGAVIYSIHEGVVYLALVHDIFGRWTLSKGGIETMGDQKELTVKKIKEEIGITITIEDTLGENEYIASDPQEGKVRKQVTYYLASASYQTLTLGETGGLDDVRWFPLAEVPSLRMYDDILPILTKGIEKITKKKNRSEEKK